MNNQKIYHGISHLDEALLGCNKVFLVCDSSFPFLNIKEDIENIKVPFVKFDEFTPNPLYEDVCKGVDLFNATQCDAILAIGGGSSLDVAKCIKLYSRLSKDKLYLEHEYSENGIKLIAIPTTAGTGSESTRYAVIYYDGKKQSVTHESIIPGITILEPKVLKTLPVYQKKCTMLDALCQGIESWWSVNSTSESQMLSKKAVSLIMNRWKEYIFDNTDQSAEDIMEAANLAGQAICITQTTAAHAFSYKITSLYKMPHGHAVAVGLPVIWSYMLENTHQCLDSRGEEYLSGVFKDIASTMGYESPREAINGFAEMMKAMEMGSPVSTDKDSDVCLLSKSVNPVRLKNNPVLLDEQAIKSLYEIIVKTNEDVNE